MSTNTVRPPDWEVSLAPGVSMVFQVIGPDCFHMGSRRNSYDEEPVHAVHIATPFYLGRYPVTQAEFDVWIHAERPTNGYAFPDEPRRPAENVSWNQAMRFCAWLTEMRPARLPDGYKATLPTEAQWEFACRAGTDTEYHTGDGNAALDAAGWCEANAERTTHPVGEKAANGFGLFDMHGNVWEWCRDAYDADAYRKRVDGSADPEVRADFRRENPARVLRGGSWRDSASGCRSACRRWWWPDARDRDQGFRVCLVPSPGKGASLHRGAVGEGAETERGGTPRRSRKAQGVRSSR